MYVDIFFSSPSSLPLSFFPTQLYKEPKVSGLQLPANTQLPAVEENSNQVSHESGSEGGRNCD